MKIVDLTGKEINACFSFNAGNCEISVSTIFRASRPEIAIFDKHSGKLLKDKLSTIPEAISWVNTWGPRD